MSLKYFNSPTNAQTITQDMSLSPNTENSCHLKLFENINHIEQMIEFKSPNKNDEYKTYHQNFINKFSTFNNGKGIVVHNNHCFGLDSSLLNNDFFDYDLTDKTEIAYLRQQKCVYLYKKNKDILIDIPVSEYNLTPISGNRSTKIRINGMIDIHENPFEKGINLFNSEWFLYTPLFGVIIDHNGDEYNPEFLMIGLRGDNFKLALYHYKKDVGFDIIQDISDFENNSLECNFGRMDDYILLYRESKKIRHYGEELINLFTPSTLTRAYTHYYHHRNPLVEDLYDTYLQQMNYDSGNQTTPFNLGLYMCPELDIRLVNFEFGMESTGY